MDGTVLRRRAGAAAGTYSSIVLGFLGTVVAAHVFSTEVLGLFTLVIASAGFFQTLLDLTIEEALIKFGFRYITREDWGRLRRLFRRTFVFKAAGAILAGGALVGLGLGAGTVFHHSELRTPLLLSALLPLAQSPEGMAAVPLMLRGRYDVRGGFLAFSMALRLGAIGAGSHFGLTWTVAAIVLAQVVASAAIGVAGLLAFHRFPRGDSRPLGEDGREILHFIGQSSVATGVVSLRSTLTPMLLGMVSTANQVGLFRVAQAPQTGFNAVSAPIRLVLLSEQTRDWERGNIEKVFAGVRRYTLLAAVGSIVLLPLLLVFMPQIVRLLFQSKNLGAVDAARIIVAAGAVQFVVGWSKSFAVTIGRPKLRIWTHGFETAVLLPLAIGFGWLWGARGAAIAVLASSIVFALAWAVLFARIRREPPPAVVPLEPEIVGLST
ncbi:MAG TPA: lipopolysaccharide biosynthesis protein [Gaiellaceae bacterium]|nr:lipopolysaccharide biosynthesis protein [Gaiellaceae bacterium]